MTRLAAARMDPGAASGKMGSRATEEEIKMYDCLFVCWFDFTFQTACKVLVVGRVVRRLVGDRVTFRSVVSWPVHRFSHPPPPPQQRRAESLGSKEWKTLVPFTPLGAGYKDTCHNYFAVR